MSLLFLINEFGITEVKSEIEQLIKMVRVYNMFSGFHISAVFLATVIIANIAREFNQGTLQKNLLDGFTRNDLYESKFWLMLALSSIIVLLHYSIFFFSANVFHEVSFSIIWKVVNFQTAIKSVISHFFYACLGFLIIMVIRKSISAVSIFLGYVLAEIILIHFNNLKWKIEEMSFLPLELITEAVKSEQNPTLNILTITLFISVFLGVAHYSFISRDIKSIR
jgi:ABC-type transport system involved in multi-copper enzyme maturation permease subunit